jgi:hypothetical protein
LHPGYHHPRESHHRYVIAGLPDKPRAYLT